MTEARTRLPETLRLGPVRLEIADLDRSADYYERVIGLRVLHRADRRVSLAPANEDTVLVELNEVPGAAPHAANGRLGLYHFAILLPSRAALGRFITHLAEINASAGQADHYVSEAFYLRDPDGLGIEVYADRPREQWPVVNGRLSMGLDQIHMESLLKESGGTAWTGMPEGTRIGHVHLHVGDMVEAERFFHEVLGLDMTSSMPAALFLSAGGYHHHLGVNTWAGNAPRPKHGDARLLEWTVVLPTAADAARVAKNIQTAGYRASQVAGEWIVTDPWDTSFRLTH